MQVVILIPELYGPENYPGFYQKYIEIRNCFERKGYSTCVIGYKSSLLGFWALRSRKELVGAELIWLRGPGVRLWLCILALRKFSVGSKILLELPSPLSTFLSKSYYGSLRLRHKLRHWLEIFLCCLIVSLFGRIFLFVVEYGNESVLMAKLLRLKAVGLLLGNIVPSSSDQYSPPSVLILSQLSIHVSPSVSPVFLVFANLAVWHGIDRLISGIGDYAIKRPNMPIPRIVVVGMVPEELQHQLLGCAREWNLEDCISFLGQRTHREFIELCNGDCIGVAALGFHRLGLLNASPLKSGFYAKSGIPFICSANDIRFAKEVLFRFQCPANDAAIDVQEVLTWYSRLDRGALISQMRDYCEIELSSDSLLAPLFKKLESR